MPDSLCTSIDKSLTEASQVTQLVKYVNTQKSSAISILTNQAKDWDELYS